MARGSRGFTGGIGHRNGRAFTAADEEFLCRRGWDKDESCDGEAWILALPAGRGDIVLTRNDTGLYVCRWAVPGSPVRGTAYPFRTIEDAVNAGALAGTIGTGG